MALNHVASFSGRDLEFIFTIPEKICSCIALLVGMCGDDIPSYNSL